MNPETRLVWHPLRDQWAALKVERLRAGLGAPHYERIETIGGDVPDVSWAYDGAEGHIELKFRADWPARAATPVAMTTVTAGQRLWWRQRSEAGGSVFVLSRIAGRWFLMEGRDAALRLGRLTQAQMLEANLLVDPTRLDLMEVLTLCRKN